MLDSKSWEVIEFDVSLEPTDPTDRALSEKRFREPPLKEEGALRCEIFIGSTWSSSSIDGRDDIRATCPLESMITCLFSIALMFMFKITDRVTSTKYYSCYRRCYDCINVNLNFAFDLVLLAVVSCDVVVVEL